MTVNHIDTCIVANDVMMLNGKIGNGKHYKYQLEYFSMERNISKVWV